MAINSAETRQALPYPYDAVFNGLVAILPVAGYQLKSRDATIGRIVAGAGMSALSWGEDIAIQVARVSATSTDVVIQSNLRVGFNLTGTSKNAQNAERIISALSHYLRRGGRDANAAVAAAPKTGGHPFTWVVSIAVGLIVALSILSVFLSS
jgi:hypothetical protein